MIPRTTVYLETESLRDVSIDCLSSKYEVLSDTEKDSVQAKIWELAKMNGLNNEGAFWGRDNLFNDADRLLKAMHILGFLGDQGLHKLTILGFQFGEGGIGAQYFSLKDRPHRNPLTGRISYINGMGVSSLEHAAGDATIMSDRILDGNNIFVVYNPSHQRPDNGMGFTQDAARMFAVNGGSVSKQVFLLVQQWLLYLNNNPGKFILQISHSEGAAHLNRALKLLQTIDADLLGRIRVINLAPAYFIDPKHFPLAQILNFVKKEDHLITWWAHGSSSINSANHVIIVDHNVYQDDVHNHPHDFMSKDYVRDVRPYVLQFMATGNLFE